MASRGKPVLSDSETRFLIELYRLHEPLWNSKSSFYRSAQHRDEAVQSIQLTFQAKFGRRLEADVIKTKLQSFRNSFSKEIGYIIKAERSGGGPDSVYVPKYPYFKELQFLQGVLKKREPMDDLPLPVWFSPKPEEEGSSLDLLVSTTEDTSNSPVSHPDTLAECSEEREEQVESPSYVSAVCSKCNTQTLHQIPGSNSLPVKLKASRGRKRGAEDDDDETGDIHVYLHLETGKGKDSDTERQDSPLGVWSKHIANEISQIKDPKKQKRIQIEISRLIQDFVSEDLDD